MLVNQYNEILDTFEDKLQKLISAHASLKEEYTELQKKYHSKEEDLILAHSMIQELRTENSHLSLASQMSGSLEKRSEARKQIDRLVREIDQCIALLNK